MAKIADEIVTRYRMEITPDSAMVVINQLNDSINAMSKAAESLILAMERTSEAVDSVLAQLKDESPADGEED